MSFEQMIMNGEIIVLTKGCIIKNHKDVYICSMSAKKIEKHLMYQGCHSTVQGTKYHPKTA